MRRTALLFPVFVLLVFGQPPARSAEAGIPHIPMPDSVYRVFRKALDAAAADRRTAPAKSELEALERLRKVPWPDVRKLERVRIPDASEPRNAASIWRLPGKGSQVALLLPDFTERVVPRAAAPKMAPVSFAQELAEVIAHLDGRKPNTWPVALNSPRAFTTPGTPWGLGLRHANLAFAASLLGRERDAADLLKAVITRQGFSFSEVYNDTAWIRFFRGTQFLLHGAPRARVAAVWESALKAYPGSGLDARFREHVAQLRGQAEEDARRSDMPDPAKLPLAEQVAYWIDRLPDARQGWWYQPQPPLPGATTQPLDALIQIGWPAMGPLVEHLTDRRLTRSMAVSYRQPQYPHLFRVQDLALRCIREITGISFYQSSHSSLVLSTDRPEVRDAAIADIHKWWDANGAKGLVPALVARLDSGRLYQRLETLQRIEKLDPKAVESVAVLKRWAESASRDDLVQLARELAARGDTSLLPAMRAMVRGAEPGRPAGDTAYLLRYGDVTDYQVALRTIEEDLRAGRQANNAAAWEAPRLPEVKQPLVVPLLVALLGERRLSGTRYVGDKPVRFGTADTAMAGLIRITGHNEGYQPDGPEEARRAAIDRWVAWWKREGLAAYSAAHPEVLQVLQGATPPEPVVDLDALPPLVSVADAEPKTPIRYDVPRAQIAALVRSGAIESRADARGNPELRFASRLAAMDWFAAAGPVAPAPGARAALTPLGRLRYFDSQVAPSPDGRVWLTDRWPRVGLAGLKRQVEAAVSSPNPHLTGARIALFDSKGRIWLVPSEEHGLLLLGYSPRDGHWVEHRTPPVPAPSEDAAFGAHPRAFTGTALESRSGRLYFADRSGVHVLDGDRWSYQPLYAPGGGPAGPSLDAGPSEAALCEDSQGRVIAWAPWAPWAPGGRPGSDGLWMDDGPAWRRLDVPDHVFRVLPRAGDELCLLTTDGQLVLLKGGERIAGEEAQKALFPAMRFRGAAFLTRDATGTSFLLLGDVTQLDTLAKMDYRAVALPAEGPALDLGAAATGFFRALAGREHSTPASPSFSGLFGDRSLAAGGWIWGAEDQRVLAGMRADGKVFRRPWQAGRLSAARVMGADTTGRVYLSGSGGVWRFDPSVPESADPPYALLPAMRVAVAGLAWPDSLGRMWCTWSVPGSPLAIHDGRAWRTLSTLFPYAGSEAQGFESAYPGANGSMVLVGDRGRFHLFDAEGAVSAPSAVELARTHAARLRKALTYPPLPSASRHSALLKDAQGSIWWADWDRAWGVVTRDGKSVDGMTSGIRLGPADQDRFELLLPVGDGTRLLAADRDAASGHERAAIIALRGGRISRIAPSPVVVYDADGRWNGGTAMRDRRGRTWVVTAGPAYEILGRSVALDGARITASHRGALMLADRKGALWFIENLDSIGAQNAILARLDPDGKETRLALPGLTGPLAEAPDGTVWALNSQGLLHIGSAGAGPAILERYPMAVEGIGYNIGGTDITCDPGGRLWHFQGKELVLYGTACERKQSGR